MQSALVHLLLMAQQAGGDHPAEAVGLAGLYEKLGWPFFVNIFISIIVLATIAERVRASMRAGTIPPGGVASYHRSWVPGAPTKTPFVHVDNRGVVITWET
jgi:hypothetical protein